MPGCGFSGVVRPDVCSRGLHIICVLLQIRRTRSWRYEHIHAYARSQSAACTWTGSNRCTKVKQRQQEKVLASQREITGVRASQHACCTWSCALPTHSETAQALRSP